MSISSCVMDTANDQLWFEVPSDCLMVLKTSEMGVCDVVELKRNCRMGERPSRLRFGGMVESFD